MSASGLYTHRPVLGLPASLLGLEGRSITALSLLQRKAGLNRERKQRLDLDVTPPARNLVPSKIKAVANSRDQNVLTYLLIADTRFDNFWRLMKQVEAGGAFQGTLSYALAIEVQLLDAFDPEWRSISLDEEVLVESCSEWETIRQRLESRLGAYKAPNAFGLFMLWPRILEDFKSWGSLSDERRRHAGHAIFALSSVGLTDWFISQALAVAPELETELGELLLLRSAGGDFKSMQDEEQDSTPDLKTADALSEEEGSVKWNDLLHRLDQVSDELHHHPTRDAVSELTTLAAEFEAASANLPVREPSELRHFEDRLQKLMEHLRSIALDAQFDWLEDDLISQIEARWKLAYASRHEPNEIKELAEDAQAALSRSSEAADAYTLTAQDLETSHQTLLATEQGIVAARGFAEQAAAKKRHTEARRAHVDAESAQQSRQELFIDAASPFSEPYDYSFDYLKRLQESPGTSLHDAASNLTEPPAEDVTTPRHNEVVTSLHDAELDSDEPEASAEEAASVFQATELAEACHDEPKPHTPITHPIPRETPSLEEKAPQEPVSTEPTSEEYSDLAGERCRPVWQQLSNGLPALAFQAAQWVETTHEGTKVPPADLLAAIALAEELTFPDGSVQASLASRFEKFSLDDYATYSPRSWHAALNLLLVAATLRPMVLAPSTGAAAVAGYLHQDGHYPELYALIHKLRGLSSKLVGFRIEPAVLRRARGEAAIRSELQILQREAEDWLHQQAPHYTIKFAPATSVWKKMVRAGGEIDSIVAPVIHNRIGDATKVKEALVALSAADHVTRLVHEIDRKTIRRLRGEDIHAGALEHLLRLIEESLRLPRQWLARVELLGHHGDRLRTLLEEVHTALRDSLPKVEAELQLAPESDTWGLIESAQRQALTSLHSLLSLFEAEASLRENEPSPAEVLGKPLLYIPQLSVSEGWELEGDHEMALAHLAQTDFSEDQGNLSFKLRLERGDLLGAEMMVAVGLVTPESGQIRHARDRWKQTVKKDIGDCRRLIEVGSAYGYLQDADRGNIESQLARWESQLEEMRRFDTVTAEIKEIRERVETARDAKKLEVRQALQAISLTEETQHSAKDVENALNDGDIAYANELLHWLEQGKPTPTDLEEDEREGFSNFFPSSMLAIEAWLEKNNRRDVIEQSLRHGTTIPGLNSRRVDGAQRAQAAEMFGAWSDMKSQQAGDPGRLKKLFTGLGLTVRGDLQRTERVSGREVWSLDAAPIDDRHICPLPIFGSFANGRYRAICVWGRPTEDDLLQWVGDVSTNHRPAILLYFGRITERKLRDLSRLAKSKRRSFILLDENLLTYLCQASGSRLSAWLDAALPFSYALPYDATAGLVPPEMFYGRSEELEAVRGLNGRCFIYGGRQLGKTALLKRAEQSFHAPKNGHFSKWIDLRAEGIGVSLAPGEIWLTLHEKLKELNVLDAKSVAPAPGKKQGVEATIKAIRDFLSTDSDRRILLLLDEADRFFEQDGKNDFEETRKLKQLMDDTQRRFKVVFAGLHNVLRMTEHPNHPLAHFGEPIEIGPLGEGDEVREAADLIRNPMAAAGFSFESKGLIVRILAQTNYYPSLIQLYCSHLIRHVLSQVANRTKTNGPRYLITDRDIEQVYSSEALRDEIRAKFRLTLQLDPRYEVLAYAMALDLLRGNYSQSEGISWQIARQSGAMYWWPEGFHETSELDFRVLLDEMVGLGVLRKLPSSNYVLRNPNVLLLLGTQEEIETVLNKEREPVVEFEATTFRPPFRRAPAQPQRNAFTYQQLSRLLQRSNEITVVAGTDASGIGDIPASLEDYLGNGGDAAPVMLNNCHDHNTFGHKLQAALSERPKDQVSVFIVPETVPWTDRWIDEARAKLKGLRSDSKFASLIFVADPATLWQQLNDVATPTGTELPWMSLLQWNDQFLRHWLDEQQLQLDSELRGRLVKATGHWPGLITELAGGCSELRTLKERLNAAEADLSGDSNALKPLRHRFGLDVITPTEHIDILAQLDEPLPAADLAVVAEAELTLVETSLRWGELLGITRRQGSGYWTVDPIASRVLRGRGS